MLQRYQKLLLTDIVDFWLEELDEEYEDIMSDSSVGMDELLERASDIMELRKRSEEIRNEFAINE